MPTTPKHPSTYDRLLARERINATPAPASGSSAGVTEIVLLNGGCVEVTPEVPFGPKFAEVELPEYILPAKTTHVSLPTKEACTHPRTTRTGRCFWCGVIVADLA